MSWPWQGYKCINVNLMLCHMTWTLKVILSVCSVLICTDCRDNSEAAGQNDGSTFSRWLKQTTAGTQSITTSPHIKHLHRKRCTSWTLTVSFTLRHDVRRCCSFCRRRETQRALNKQNRLKLKKERRVWWLQPWLNKMCIKGEIQTQKYLIFTTLMR